MSNPCNPVVKSRCALLCAWALLACGNQESDDGVVGRSGQGGAPAAGAGAAPASGGTAMGESGASGGGGTAGLNGTGGSAPVAGASEGGVAGAAGAGEEGAGRAAGGQGGSAGSAGSSGFPALAGAAGEAGGTGGTGGAAPRCPAGPFATPRVESEKRVCENFAFKHTYNEGATWVASEKAFFFTNFVMLQPTGGDIIKYTPGGQCEIFISGVGCNGLAVASDGDLLAACHQSRSVIKFDLETKEPTTLASEYMGTMLDTPNDLVMHSNGTIYFTNPTFELGNRPPGVGRSVFRIDPAGTLHLIGASACNGIALSPDERTLYVLQAGMWQLDAQGVPSNRQNLFTSGDGMAVDCAGNIYASRRIFSPQGEDIGEWGAGTNLAFGGEDGKTLLVVGPNTTVRELRMTVPGLP